MRDLFGQCWLRIRDATVRYATAATVPVMVGVLMLALIALLYLGPHANRFWDCGFDQVRSSIGKHQTKGKCWQDGLDRLRQDGTAAVILLAIAAAFPISAWRGDAQSVE